jgi:hypothetical protein
MSDDLERRVFDFTREEWIRAFAFDMSEHEATAEVDAMFAQHMEYGSEGFVFPHKLMLRLAYVSADCRARILGQLGQLGTDPITTGLLNKLRRMDRDARASGLLRHAPASDPL